MFNPILWLMPGLQHIAADGSQEQMPKPAFEQTVEKFLVFLEVRKTVEEVGGVIDLLI